MPSEDKHARTEPPTPKRRKEARDKGQVARSPDVSGWASLLLGTFLVPWLFSQVESRVLEVLNQSTQVMRNPTVPGALAVLAAGLRTVVIVVVPLGGVFALAAVVANLAQVGRAFSLKAARPRFNRVSPRTGLKRLFGTQTLAQLAKQTLKLAVLGVIGYEVVLRLARAVTGTSPVGLGPIVGDTAGSILSFVRIISLIGVAIGIGDFAFQKHKLTQSLKMTKQEVKDESRAAEGDPAMKGELKKRMYAIARSRVRAAVRKADVVITNPTHYAVALVYSPGATSAPVVVAKGADALAATIREQARDADVPLVEDPPLARYLYAVCEVDQQIPTEIYLAVAKLLAFLYSLPAPVRTMRVHQATPTELPGGLSAIDALPEARRKRAAAMVAGTA